MDVGLILDLYVPTSNSPVRQCRLLANMRRESCIVTTEIESYLVLEMHALISPHLCRAFSNCAIVSTRVDRRLQSDINISTVSLFIVCWKRISSTRPRLNTYNIWVAFDAVREITDLHKKKTFVL